MASGLTVLAKVAMMSTDQPIAEARAMDKERNWSVLHGDTKIDARKHVSELTTIPALYQKKAAEIASGREEVEPEPPRKELDVAHRGSSRDSLKLTETVIPLSNPATFAETSPVWLIYSCKSGSVGVQPGLSEGYETRQTIQLQAVLAGAAGVRRARATPNSLVLHRLPSLAKIESGNFVFMTWSCIFAKIME